MNNKRRIIDLIEFYINDHRNEDLNLMYGNGSKIKIKDIGYSTSNKSIFIDCSIILGDIKNLLDDDDKNDTFQSGPFKGYGKFGVHAQDIALGLSSKTKLQRQMFQVFDK